MRMHRPSRSGFTIVEMMVATALILFIMAIISEVFASASKTYTTLKVAGDLQERLRLGATIFRRDLTSEHFDGPFIPGRSGPRVGDQRLDQAGWVPPTKGYFEIRQFGEVSGSNPLIPVLYEPGTAVITPNVADPEGIWSSRATNHIVRFTVKLPDLPAAELHCAGAKCADQ